MNGCSRQNPDYRFAKKIFMEGSAELVGNCLENRDTAKVVTGCNSLAFRQFYPLLMELQDMLALEASARKSVGVEISRGGPILLSGNLIMAVYMRRKHEAMVRFPSFPTKFSIPAA